MFLRLWHGSIWSRYHQDASIHLGSSCNHVLQLNQIHLVSDAPIKMFNPISFSVINVELEFRTLTIRCLVTIILAYFCVYHSGNSRFHIPYYLFLQFSHLPHSVACNHDILIYLLIIILPMHYLLSLYPMLLI